MEDTMGIGDTVDCQDCGMTRPFAWMGGTHECLVVGEPTISPVGGYAPAVYYQVTEENLEWLRI